MAKNTKFTLVAWGGEDLIDYLAITGQLQRLTFDDGDTTIELRDPYEGLPLEKKAEIIRSLLKASHQQPTRRKKWWETAIPQEEAERIDRIIEAVKRDMEEESKIIDDLTDRPQTD